MTFAAFDACIDDVFLLLTQEPAEVAAMGAEGVEAWHDPAQHLVCVVTFGNDVHFGCMSTKETFGRCLETRHHVTADDASTFSINRAVEERGQLLADLHLVVLRRLHLATSKRDGAGEIDCASLQETTQEDNFLGSECPNHFALVDGVDVIDLNAHITCRSGTVEDVHLAVLSLGQSLSGLLCTHAKINLCELCQSGKTSLELSLLTLEDVLEVLTQRHAVERAHKDSLRSVLGICHHIVGTLTQEGKQTALQHEGLDVALCVELACFLLLVSLHTDAQQFATVAAFHHADCSADRAHELHFGMQLVNEQGIPSLHGITLLDHHFGFHTIEVIGNECILARTTYGRGFLRGFAFEIDVEAFA